MNVRALLVPLLVPLVASLSLTYLSCGGDDTIFYCGAGTAMPCDAKVQYCELAFDATLKSTTTCRSLPASGCTGEDLCTTCLSAANIANYDECTSNSTGGSTRAYLVTTSTR